MKINMTLEQLERLLNAQKELVIIYLSSNTSSYNAESTDGCLKSLPINEFKMKEIGMKAKFPEEFNTLKKYLTP